jgi:hypothetical protein
MAQREARVKIDVHAKGKIWNGLGSLMSSKGWHRAFDDPIPGAKMVVSCAPSVMPPATSPNCRSESTTRRLGRLTLAPRKDGRRNIGS